jgi:hypothetical protein
MPTKCAVAKKTHKNDEIDIVPLQPKKRLTIAEAVRRIKEAKPSSASQLEKKCNMKLDHLGSGSERVAFRIKGLPVVVKFPICKASGQSWNEYRSYRHIMKTPELKCLRPLMPKIYAYNRTGRCTVMRLYKGIGWEDTEPHEMNVRNKMRAAGCGDYHDLHLSNLGLTPKGKLKVIDLGCFGVI